MSEIKTNVPSSTMPTNRSGLQLVLTMPILAWALYDFANTIFSSNIVTIFFPFYVNEIVGNNEQYKAVAETFTSYTNALASLLLVLFSPLFGVWIDRTRKKNTFLKPMAIICIICTALMGVTAMLDLGTSASGLPIAFLVVLVLFMLAKFFYQSSLIFYDAMISDLGNARELPVISGIGVALGYTGTLLGLAVYPIVTKGQSYEAFIPTAILFLLFSLPIFFSFKEKHIVPVEGPKKSFFSGYRDIWETFLDARQYKAILLFLIAYFFFNDAMATAITMMGSYSSKVIGFSAGKFVIFYLVSTVASIFGSFIFGYVTRRIGAKWSVAVVALLMTVALVMASLVQSEGLFWVVGSLFGIALGSMWVTSRTLIVELTPEEKRGQFFGLFAFSGKLSAIVGPLMYGTIVLVFQDLGNTASRMAIGSLAVLVLVGLVVHLFVPYRKAA